MKGIQYFGKYGSMQCVKFEILWSKGKKILRSRTAKLYVGIVHKHQLVSWKFDKLMIVRVSCVIVSALCMIVRKSELRVSFANNNVVTTLQSTIFRISGFFFWCVQKTIIRIIKYQVFEHWSVEKCVTKYSALSVKFDV